MDCSMSEHQLVWLVSKSVFMGVGSFYVLGVVLESTVKFVFKKFKLQEKL